MNSATVDCPHGLVGQSPQIREVRRLIEKVSRSRAPVMLLGETGTGKEVVARAIHNANPTGNFVPIDCGSLVGPLMESELFGHTRGAFTGAGESKKGLVEQADGGTAFFDEIGDLPLEMQVKLLRLLQEREFRPVGSLRQIKVDIRVIAATHRDLAREVEHGRFRQDLFYRLNVVKIRLPALRDRKEDVPLLIEHFLSRSDRNYELSEDALQALCSHEWPGNVRELKNCIEAMITLNSGPRLDVADLPSLFHYSRRSSSPPPVAQVDPEASVEDAPLLVRRSPRGPVLPLEEVERQSILDALGHTRGDRAKAAQLLGISRTTLYRKLKDYQIPD